MDVIIVVVIITIIIIPQNMLAETKIAFPKIHDMPLCKVDQIYSKHVTNEEKQANGYIWE